MTAPFRSVVRYGVLCIGIFAFLLTLTLNFSGDPSFQHHVSTAKSSEKHETAVRQPSSRAWWLWFSIVSADWLIAGAYLAIPLELLFFWIALGRDSRIDSTIILLFIAFISLCGTTHIASAVFDDSRYARAIEAASGPYPSAFLVVSKVTTAIVSVFTAIYTVRLLPQFMRMPVQLEELQSHLLERVRFSKYQVEEKEEERKSRERIELLHKHLDPAYILACSSELIQRDFNFERTTILELIPHGDTGFAASTIAEHRRQTLNTSLLSEPAVFLPESLIMTMRQGKFIHLHHSHQVNQLLSRTNSDVSELILFPLFSYSESAQVAEDSEMIFEREFNSSASAKLTPNYLLVVQRCRQGLFGSEPIETARLASFVTHVQSTLSQAHLLRLNRQAVQLLSERARQLELAREDAERASRVKSDFIAMISHEIRTPMQAIIALSDLLLEQESPLDANLRGNLETIRGSASILSMIVNDILDLTKFKIETWKPEIKPMILRNVIEEAICMVYPHAKKKEKLDICYFLDESVPREIESDPNRLTQVLINLLHNAVKHTDEGWIAVRVTHDPQSKELNFSVKDTGTGIPPALQQSLFKKFTQLGSQQARRGQSGLGLGLAICRKVIQKLGGKIWVESTGIVGEGCDFKFTIQYSGVPKMPERLEIKKNVVLVTASPVLRDQITEQFRAIGMKVQTLNQVDSTLLELLKQREPHIAAALIDVRAPGAESLTDSLNSLGPKSDHISSRLTMIACQANPSVLETVGNLQLLLKPIRLSFLEDLVSSDSDRHITTVHSIDSLPEASYTTGNATGKSSTSTHHTSPTETPLVRHVFPPVVSSSSSEGSRFSDVGKRHGSDPASTRPSPPHADPTSVSILIAEDNIVIQRVFKTLLTKLGVQSISFAETGVQALDILHKAPKSIELIIMDINMPEMDGVTCTRRIRSEYGKGAYYIVGVSAASTEQKEDYLLAGMDDFITKPAKLVDLQNALQRYFEKRARRNFSVSANV